MWTSDTSQAPGYEGGAQRAQASTDAPLLAAVDLSHRRGDGWVLGHLNFSLQSGEVVWLTGDNGAGKSTLLHLLAGLMRPSQGQVWAFGRPSHRLRGSQRRRLGLMGHATFCSQPLGGLANLMWPARLGGLSAAAARARARALLAEVGLEQVSAALPVACYSAGMRRRLALGRMLMAQPEVMLVDEPFAQLDEAGAALAAAALRRRHAAGAALLFTSHQRPPAEVPGGRRLHLRGGRLSAEAS